MLWRAVMMTASLVAASFVALLQGQSGTDQQAYAVYQVKLARLLASEPGGEAGGKAIASVQAGCILASGTGSTATTQDCLACHPSHQGRSSHPVDVDQDAASSRSRRGSGPTLRSAAEVVKRGVFLADGKVSCLTCHDGNSIWKHKIALPPDAQLREPVRPGDQRTYDPALLRTSAMAGLDATTGKRLLPAGTEVSPTPLCKVCHSFD